MSRFLLCGLVAAALCIPSPTRGDSFDHYTNVILTKVPKSAGTQQVKQLTPQQMVENARVLPGVHNTSSWPPRLSTRASTNSKSDSRFR